MLWKLTHNISFSLALIGFHKNRPKMKKINACASSGFLLCLFLLLVFTASVLGRSLSSVKTEQGEQKIVANGIHPYKEDFSNVMGLDMVECEKEDEECVTRRIMAEAHLDYIYTQSQNPT